MATPARSSASFSSSSSVTAPTRATSPTTIHLAFNADERFLPIYRHADQDNKPIAGLSDFADAFLAKCTLAQLISKYMVLVASEQMLLVMRPYQIYAVKHIVDCIEKRNGNGYVWHTTGSGKTLTSFKASTLLRDNKAIDKCFFVVDRKDLDRQTREEFNRFQEGCVEENTNVYTLVRRLLSDDKSDNVTSVCVHYTVNTGLGLVIQQQKFGRIIAGDSFKNYIVLKKCKKYDDVLFINASGPENFAKGKRQNQLRKQDIEKIVRTY